MTGTGEDGAIRNQRRALVIGWRARVSIAWGISRTPRLMIESYLHLPF
jgi:hypothetical protein